MSTFIGMQGKALTQILYIFLDMKKKLEKEQYQNKIKEEL